MFVNKVPHSEPNSLSEEEEYNARFSDLETFGIKPDQEISPVLSDFNSTIRFNQETHRYKVRLPVIGKYLPKLKDCFQVSMNRLDSIFGKIRNPKHAEYAKQYCAIIKEQETLGVIERVSDISPNHRVCYIPHHGVLQDGKLALFYNLRVKRS